MLVPIALLIPILAEAAGELISKSNESDERDPHDECAAAVPVS